MASSLSGKYFLISAEAEGQNIMEMLEMTAASIGKRAGEMMVFDFSSNGKVTMEVMGESNELTFTVKGNTVKIAGNDGEEMELAIDGNKLTGIVNGTNSVFCDTLPAEVESEGESGVITHELEGITVTLELPEKGWCTERNLPVWTMPTLYLYNKPSLRKKGFFPPAMEFMTHESVSEFDLIFDDGFKKRTEIKSRKIGGIDMKGRRWITDLGNAEPASKNKIEHIEYIGEYGGGKGIHVLIDDLDIESGEVKTILDSIRFTVE